jgi:hypothetical protein
MGGNNRARWRPGIARLALALIVVVAGCARQPPAPLTESANGRSIVLGPEPGFNPAAPPRDWFLAPPRGTDSYKVVELSGTPVLRIEGSGGSLLGRRLATPLLAAPFLHAGWYLDAALFNGGPRDGLPRGLRLVVGFSGGTSTGTQLIDRIIPGDLPVHDRFFELRLGGLGTTRAEDARLELAAVSDGGLRRVLRGAQGSEAGHWHLEAVDLAALYAAYWPRDRIGKVEIAFIAVGSLQHHPLPTASGHAAPAPAGYVAEILLTR